MFTFVNKADVFVWTTDGFICTRPCDYTVALQKTALLFDVDMQDKGIESTAEISVNNFQHTL